MKRRGAPRVTEREDPLTFVLRNRPAREILERLSGKPSMIPINLRKEIGAHPETFRRAVSNLDDFALISIRTFPRRASEHRPRENPLRPPTAVKLTERGENVLEVARGVRALVQRRAGLLPESSAEHWLSAPGTLETASSRGAS